MLKILLAGGAACMLLAVAVVAGATPTANEPPSNPSGTAQVGQTVSITPGTYTGTDGAAVTVSDQWQRCDDNAGNGCVATGAPGASYSVVAGDLGKYLRVAETASDGVDPSAGPVYTATTAQVVAAFQAPQLVTAPAIAGANLNLGQSLSRTPGTWSGNPTPTVTAAWQRCTTAAATSCDAVGSSATSYTLAAADVGKYMRVWEVAANGQAPNGQAPSNLLGPVTQPLAPATAPAIDRTAPLVAETITVTSTGTWTGFPQPTGFAYAWQRCDTSAGANCVGVGTGAAAYVVAPGDAGKWLRVQVTASNGLTQAVSAWVQTAQAVRQAPTPSAAPTIAPSNGDMRFTVGATSPLTLSVTNNGAWAAFPAVSAYAYQWQRCSSSDVASCVAIPGATTTPYTAQQADVGSFLRVQVAATNGVDPAGVAFSPLTALQVRQSPPYQGTSDAATPPPSIVDPNNDGKPSVGETLQGLAGTWFAFPAPTLTPAWLRCDPLGNNCKAVTPAPPITPGVATGPEPYRHTNPAGSWPYPVTDADLGSTLKLVVTAGNNVVSATVQRASAVTGVVQAAPVNLAAAPNGLPALTGTAVRASGAVANVLTASSGLWTGFSLQGSQPVTITHLWQRCPASGSLDNCVPVSTDPPLPVTLTPGNALTCTSIAPCGGSSQYPLSDADLGSRIRVVVTASNSLGTVTLATPPSEVVVGAPVLSHLGNGDPDPAAKPKVTGTAQPGYTLAASTGSWSAYPSDSLVYALQWLRCPSATATGNSCSPVAGATDDTYLLSSSDVGSFLRVRVTATNGVDPAGMAESDATAKVVGGGGGGSGANLAALLRASTAGNQVTYTVRVVNVGSAAADGVALTATLPDNLTVVSSATTRGSCSGRVTCAIGQVKAGETVIVTIVVTASQTGTYSFSATVTSSTPDVDPSNNTVSTGSRLSSVGSTPVSGGSGKTPDTGPGSSATKPTVQRVVPLKSVNLRARRVGRTWVASTAFTMFSGKAALQMSVTPNGSTTPLKLLAGSRFGPSVGKAGATKLTFTASKAATFPVKVVLPAQGFSRKAVYVIRITATAGGGSSALNIGFKGVTLLTRSTAARSVGTTWVTGSVLQLPTGKGTTLQAWVTPRGSATKLRLLKGSSIGRTVIKGTRVMLGTTAARRGNVPVRVVLASKGLSAKKVYVVHAEAKAPDGIWTDYEIRFTGKGAARLLTKAKGAGHAPASTRSTP